MSKLSVIIIAKNEERDIEDALKSAIWADEVILLDGGSTDDTLKIAQRYPVRIVPQTKTDGLDYAAWHNQGLDQTGCAWIFYLDADERFTPGLVEEIKTMQADPAHSVWAVPRRNYLLGRELRHGGWYPDYQIRLFKKADLVKWEGKLHEHPVYRGSLGYAKQPIIHVQPETLEPMYQKSIKWSAVEADRLLAAGHPPVAWWRVTRMGGTTLFDRLIKKQGWRDGVEGWIESLYQAYHTAIVYLRLWELQKQTPSQ